MGPEEKVLEAWKTGVSQIQPKELGDDFESFSEEGSHPLIEVTKREKEHSFDFTYYGHIDKDGRFDGKGKFPFLGCNDDIHENLTTLYCLPKLLCISCYFVFHFISLNRCNICEECFHML